MMYTQMEHPIFYQLECLVFYIKIARPFIIQKRSIQLL